MTNKNFSLDDIRAAADKKYASTFIEVGDTEIELVNILRLPKEKRDELFSIQKESDEGEDNDVEAALTRSLYLVAKEEGGAKLLLDAIGGDLAVLSQVFETYSGETELGEASGSES